jgi:F0F1-type ATP synthase membrane subunit c/vacuolar-type H+-ATPase subunit K
MTEKMNSRIDYIMEVMKMKSKRIKSVLLIGLAMLVASGIIWGSVSAANASAAARTKKSIEQNMRTADGSVDVKEPVTSEGAATPKADETSAQIRNRAGENGAAEKDNADNSGARTRARDGNDGENCDETCPNYETRDERREQNRSKAEGRTRDRANGENCDETCPNYETRDERREQNRAKAEERTRDRANGENCDETCPNHETREERREQNRSKNRTP